MHYCERFGSDDNSEVKVSVSPLRVLSERVFQLETLRIHELRRRLTAASLISSFRRLSLSEQRMLVGIDIDEAVRYVAGKRLPRQLHRTTSHMDASLFMVPLGATAMQHDVRAELPASSSATAVPTAFVHEVAQAPLPKPAPAASLSVAPAASTESVVAAVASVAVVATAAPVASTASAASGASTAISAASASAASALAATAPSAAPGASVALSGASASVASAASAAIATAAASSAPGTSAAASAASAFIASAASAASAADRVASACAAPGCRSRHGYNPKKCVFCANCCTMPLCSVKSHRRARDQPY